MSASALSPSPSAAPPPPRADYFSWGRYPRVTHTAVERIAWRDRLPATLRSASPSVLAYGLGRSYGDVCLNAGGTLLDLAPCNRILEADWSSGSVRLEAGASIADLLQVALPRGWFPPVTPGTKFVTLGGAVANDVHGKNHHRAGTFGCHVRRLLLYRGDGSQLICSRDEDPALFSATIGGLGLTGVIGWVELQMKPVRGALMDVETFAFSGLEEFATLAERSDSLFDYTVAWLDCFSGRRARGIFFRGNHAEVAASPARAANLPAVPFAAPSWALGSAPIKLFNAAYYAWKGMGPRRTRPSYDSFFYPLDAVANWNLLYGRRGFVQYQCVVPELSAIEQLLDAIAAANQGSFLAVLKKFGGVASPGLLSFPRPGLTLALDFPMLGARTLRLLEQLDAITMAAGGALYPAKDARMSPQAFAASFPRWRELASAADAKFSSSFWRRVTGAAP